MYEDLEFEDYELYSKPLVKTDLFIVRTGNNRMKQIKLTYYILS